MSGIADISAHTPSPLVGKGRGEGVYCADAPFPKSSQMSAQTAKTTTKSRPILH